MLRFAGSDLGFDHRAFQALVRHFAYLTIVDVNQCPGLTSAMCQTILVSCTELRIFSADTLHARDILGLTVEGDKINEGELVHEPQAWVCTKLQQLTLYICGLEGKPADWQRLILRQLAKLTRLTFLSIVPEDGNWNGTEDSRDGLDLRIEAGLGILSSLKLLDSIEFTGLWQQMEEQDLRWMLDAWPRLRDVGGKVHHSEERRLELEKIFEERPVVVKTKMDDSEDFYYNFYFNAHESSDEDEEDCY
ncbi:hypothetical protein BGZ54_006167 [Gamsiella multidivaricata]|nr:hypothetical protein BGZ54_006167 [Gamsiella multidivaricata]